MSALQHQSYKATGLSWLPSVPCHWEIVAPKRRLTSRGGGTLIKGQCHEEPKTGLFQGFSASGPDVWLEAFDFDQPGIVLSAVGARCGKAFKAQGKWGVVANTHCLFPREGVDRNFAWYLTNSEDWWEKGGTAQPFVKVSETLGRLWAFPPHDEQIAIVTFLDRETGKIDTLVGEQRRLIELLKEKRQAVISDVVTKGLDRNAKMKSTLGLWMGDVPERWEVTPVRSVARLESGHTPSRSHPEWWENCTVPWFSLADIWQVRKEGRTVITETSEQVSEIGLANSSARVLPAGTVMLSRTASVGFAAIMGVDMATTQDFANWVCGPKLNNHFLLWTLRAMRPEFSRLMMGSTHNTIYMPDLAAFRMPLPTLEEQLQLVTFLQSETGKIDSLLHEANVAIELLNERRSALIAAAVTGKIDLRDTTAAETIAA